MSIITKAVQNTDKYKISFCTTCMNRLDHLKETLPVNIIDNLEYNNIEFVLLNYNSNDELDNWVKNEMISYIKSGILVYIKTFEPEYWNVSHAKNMAAKFSSGDIICNIDADNFIGKNYSHYINDLFQLNTNIFLSGRSIDGESGAMGRSGSWKTDFLKVGGYDEGILGYGYDDTDFYRRLLLLGREEVAIDSMWLKTIPHENFERIKNTQLNNDIKYILTNDSRSRAFIINKNFEFEYIQIAPYEDDLHIIKATIDENSSMQGKWINSNSDLILQTIDNKKIILTTNDLGNTYLFNNDIFTKLTNEENVLGLLYYSLLLNQKVYNYNKQKSDASFLVNTDGLGNGIVYKNFNYETPHLESLSTSSCL